MSSDIDKLSEPAHTPYPYNTGRSVTPRIHEVVLKLYDRRFGELRKRRELDGRKRPRPHTEESEAAFQDSVRSGMVARVLERLKQADLMWDLHIYNSTPSDEEDEGTKSERVVGFPGFFKAVTLQLPSAPSDIEPSYFQVPGILIEKIDGFNLSNLVTEMPTGPPELWAEIVQKGTDLAIQINRAGVLDEDSQPRNVLVTRAEDNTYQVRRIDFGEASIESDLIYYRGDEPDLFKQCATTAGNPCAIGLVMASKVERLTGVKLNIVFDEIWPGIGGLPP
ncbi:hypothetical protein F5Y01DRAFT_310277 [Xylaria sp. FL0043]|nr:hypothetical protein F5Y01DRAFT_310277 [Xylaria sp. FL0043]